MNISWLSQSWRALGKPRPLSASSSVAGEDDWYRRLIDSSPQPILVQAEGQVVYANAAVVELLGALDATDLVGRSIDTLIHPDFHSAFHQHIRQVLAEDAVAPLVEEKLVTLSGDILDVEVKISRVFYRGQAAIQVVMQDVTGRKQTEAALRTSEERFRAFMELIPAFTSIKDEAGRFVYLNSRSQQLYDVPVSQMMGRTNWDHLPPESAARLLENERNVLLSGPSQNFIENLMLADGSIRDFLLIKFPLREANGRALLAGIALDITDRVQAENALRDNQKRLQLILSNLPVMVVGVDRHGVIVLSEGKGLQAMEATGRNQVGHSMWQCYGDVPQVLENTRRGLNGETFDSEVEIDGRILQVFITPLCNEAGNDGFLAVSLDITERRQAENERDELLMREQEARRAAEEARIRMTDILDSSNDGFYALDREWHFIYVNRQAEAALSHSRQSLLGQCIWDIFPELRASLLYEEFHAALQSGQATEFEFFLPVPDRYYVVRVYPASDSLSVFFLDITARQQAETEQRELMVRLTTVQEEERWRIARDLHDQLGQDLAVLMLGLKSLSKNHRLTLPVGKSVEELQNTVNTLVQQVRQVALNLRSEALGTLGLPAALRRYSDEWSRHHALEVAFHDWGFQNRYVAPHIEATIYRIVQESFTNVLRHADATLVSLILEHRDDHVLTIIEDNGQGFDLEAVAQRPLSERGLGLRGIKERVALVNGTLQIESRDGDGTTIYVRVPIEEQNEEQQE